jgi:outer membrane protein assembly factor BamB
VPILIDLLACPVNEFAWQAEDLLLRLASETPTVPALDPAKENGRREYRDRWAKWWSDNAGKIDLSRVDSDPPQRGWTVVAQMSTSKVYELDRQGKVRWNIEGLSGPIDAQILTGDRLLIAEHHGSRVTERNLQGTVLWEKKLDDRPVQVHRLPGGNTFICTYSAVMEVKRDGTQVYCHRPEGTSGQIYAGHKLRNGHIVCITLDGRILELESTTGKLVKSFNSGLSGCYSIQSLPRGNYLVSSYNEGKVHEIDGAGKVVWKYELASAYHAERLPSGNTLVSSHGGSRVVEVDRNGKVLNEQGTNSNNVWRVHRR